MSNKPSLKRNYIYRLLYQFLSMATPLITAPYISRVLGADGVGIYSYTQSWVTYFTYLALLGTGSYGALEIAKCRDDKKEYSKTFWEIELLTVITSSLSLFFWFLFIVLSKEYQIYFLALTPLILAQTFDIEWFYAGHERIGYSLLWNSVCKIAGLVCIFVFIRDKSDLLLYIFLSSFIMMAGSVSMWVHLPKMLTKVKLSELSVFRHFKKTFVYFIPTIATSVYTILDKTLIGVFTNDSFENGYYEQATKIINILKPVSFAALNSVMTARMSYLFYSQKTDEMKKRIGLSVDITFFTTFGCMFGMVAVANTFVPLFFGPGYEPVVKLLQMMAILLFVISISNCLSSHYYIPVGRMKQYNSFLIAGSVVNLILNISLIPSFGAMGAVVGSIGAELVITLLLVRFDDGYLKWSDILRCGYKKLIAGVIMLIAVLFIGNVMNLSVFWELAVQVVSGACIYIVVLFILRDTSISYLLNVVLSKLRITRGVRS